MNFLETLVFYLFAIGITALTYPTIAVIEIISFAVLRFLYTVTYWSHPNYRTKFAKTMFYGASGYLATAVISIVTLMG